MVLNKIARDLVRKPEIIPIVTIVSLASVMGSAVLVRTVWNSVQETKADKSAVH